MLLANPYWEVREVAGSLAISLAEIRPEMIALVREMLRDDNWRLRYATMDVALGICHLDEQQSFLEAVRTLYADRHSWLRGMCASCVTAWLLNCDPDKRPERLALVAWALAALLRDEDAWVLEEMHRLFHELDVTGMEVASLLAKGVSPLLQNQPEWFRLRRDEFRRLLEKEKITRVASLRVTEVAGTPPP